MTMEMVLLLILLAATVWTVMTTRLLRAVIGLALTSVILTILMYRFGAPLAGVFELSVCAGLIPVIFVTTVSFTQRLTPEKLVVRKKERMLKFWFLPVLIVLVGMVLTQVHVTIDFPPVSPEALRTDPRAILWNLRHLDLVGQIAVLLAGVFGVVVFFKEDPSCR
ncbi:MAG: hypothetical protein PHS61_01890 [Candidatus Omnitrophica bacterium]|nr:hypothetical protein [Candidatus Omnitrophota bacterium]